MIASQTYLLRLSSGTNCDQLELLENCEIAQRSLSFIICRIVGKYCSFHTNLPSASQKEAITPY